MSEHGGTTTQAGIIYQNSVAALYLGRMLDAQTRPDRERVTAVRVEAPTEVDDIVVDFADNHRMYIQAKINVRVGDNAWDTLWRHVSLQFAHRDFRADSDRLHLRIGRGSSRMDDLREMCERAITSESYSEWHGRMSVPQRDLQAKIRPLLPSVRGDQGTILALFKHIEVEVTTQFQLERDDLARWLPSSTIPQVTLFRLLRDRVGGESRIRKRFTPEDLRRDLEQTDKVHLKAVLSLDELLCAAKQCGSLLRAHIAALGATGLRVQRPVIDDIVEWVSDTDREGSLALLTDQAGMGKTVVLRDTLLALERRGIPVLAIKADMQLSGVASHEELAARLQLPDSVERVVAALSAHSAVAVLIDQVDALSLSMAHDERALGVVLDLVARLRTLPKTIIIVSCRTFDRSNDPRLRSLQVDRTFSAQEFDDTQVAHILQMLGVAYASLAPATRALLRVPLHLHLFARLLSTGGGVAHGQPIANLQDLYALLWRDVILAPVSTGPYEADRVEVIDLLTDHMHRMQRTSAPQSLFLAPHLMNAIRWLASAGILVPGQDSWGFLHQTFFDYCYARRFVKGGGRLAPEIRTGNQGLFVRPLLVQVLAYLRGSDPSIYLQELCDLAMGIGLRYHLQNLVWRWFGALPDPSEAEWSLARRWLADAAVRPRLLSAMAGNRAWFARLRGSLPQMLRSLDDAVLDAEIIPYLATMIPVEQADVVSLVQIYVGRSAPWRHRISWLLMRVRAGHTAEIVGLIETLVQADTSFAADHFLFLALDTIAEAHPASAGRLIRLLCERILDNHLVECTEDPDVAYYQIAHLLEALNSGTLNRALKIIVDAAPRQFLETLLPWLERAVAATEGRARSANVRELWFPRDGLSYNWFDGIYAGQRLLIEAIIDALVELARRDYLTFRSMTVRLEMMLSWTPQHLLALVYRKAASHSADDAFAFLLADTRRLNLGESQGFDSRKLIEAIYPFLAASKKARLEAFILAYNPRHRTGEVYDLRYWGLEQLFLLQSLPRETLSAQGVRRLRELERKFPGIRASPTRIVMEGGVVDSPIEHRLAERMSDRAWMRAMRKYHDSVEHPSFLKGGAHELANVLQERTKADPYRFYRLAMRAPQDTDAAYVMAFLQGLAQAAATAVQLIDVIRCFAERSEEPIKLTIAHAVDRRTDQGEPLPADLLDLLEGYVRDEGRNLRESDKEPFIAAINSSRGAALLTLTRALFLRGTARDHQRIWLLIEDLATSPSTTLRAAALEPLLRELPADRDRAIALYERLLEGHPVLLRTRYAQDFLYYALYRHFQRLAPYVRELMDEVDEAHQQRGAEIACIAAISASVFSEKERQLARGIADDAITGPAAWRRGAAHVYAQNIARDDSGTCARELVRLLDDDDKAVRQHVSEVFSKIDDEHTISMRSLVIAFAASRALHDNRYHFAQFLLDHEVVDPEGALLAVAAELDNRAQGDDVRRAIGAEDLIRVVVRAYSDPTVVHLRERAMDLFDRLMERDESAAHAVLGEWDRR